MTKFFAAASLVLALAGGMTTAAMAYPHHPVAHHRHSRTVCTWSHHHKHCRTVWS